MRWARSEPSAASQHPVGDGAYSAFASFSFHPVKTLATGEGGMLTTNDAGLAARARSLRGHGMVRPPGSDPWWYEMPEIGFNYRLPDVLCALGISQLAKLDRFVARRRALTARYAERLARCRRACAWRPALTIPTPPCTC
jgi:dTDP-4-amino-4,6-dideoxygalactose transaminase